MIKLKDNFEIEKSRAVLALILMGIILFALIYLFIILVVLK